MLILNVLDDWVPASIVVNLVAITWSIHNVQPQADTVFFDDMGDGLDFGCGSYGFVRSKSSFRVDQV